MGPKLLVQLTTSSGCLPLYTQLSLSSPLSLQLHFTLGRPSICISNTFNRTLVRAWPFHVSRHRVTACCTSCLVSGRTTPRRRLSHCRLITGLLEAHSIGVSTTLHGSIDRCHFLEPGHCTYATQISDVIVFTTGFTAYSLLYYQYVIRAPRPIARPACTVAPISAHCMQVSTACVALTTTVSAVPDILPL